MRVISGRAKGHRLKMVPGDSTRPITDRVKENLFNILGDWVIGTRWLDLFAGTGQVGIEALSRGARQVDFVDSSRLAVKIIKENLAHTRLSDGAVVSKADAFTFIRRKLADLSGDQIAAEDHHYDVIYIAPPQYHELWSLSLAEIDKNPGILSPEGMAIAQIDPKEFAELAMGNLVLVDQRTYGRTMLCFYERGDPVTPQVE